MMNCCGMEQNTVSCVPSMEVSSLKDDCIESQILRTMDLNTEGWLPPVVVGIADLSSLRVTTLLFLRSKRRLRDPRRRLAGL